MGESRDRSEPRGFGRKPKAPLAPALRPHLDPPSPSRRAPLLARIGSPGTSASSTSAFYKRAAHALVLQERGMCAASTSASSTSALARARGTSALLQALLQESLAPGDLLQAHLLHARVYKSAARTLLQRARPPQALFYKRVFHERAEQALLQESLATTALAQALGAGVSSRDAFLRPPATGL